MLKVLNALMDMAGAKRAAARDTRKLDRQDIEALFRDDFAAHAMVVKQRKAAARTAKAA